GGYSAGGPGAYAPARHRRRRAEQLPHSAARRAPAPERRNGHRSGHADRSVQRSAGHGPARRPALARGNDGAAFGNGSPGQQHRRRAMGWERGSRWSIVDAISTYQPTIEQPQLANWRII